MANPQPEKKYFTTEEYFDKEEYSEIRHDFRDGELFVVAGTTINHNILTRRLASLFDAQLEEKGCFVVNENVKLELEEDTYYVYPDVMVVCDSLAANGRKAAVKYPSLIAEVLSKSTEEYDKGTKLYRYRKIPTLQYYILVSQYMPLIEIYTRTANPREWNHSVYEDVEDVISLNQLEITIALKAIYRNITFIFPTKEDQN
jgi:Uma2 family endonuclease